MPRSTGSSRGSARSSPDSPRRSTIFASPTSPQYSPSVSLPRLSPQSSPCYSPESPRASPYPTGIGCAERRTQRASASPPPSPIVEIGSGFVPSNAFEVFQRAQREPVVGIAAATASNFIFPGAADPVYTSNVQLPLVGRFKPPGLCGRIILINKNPGTNRSILEIADLEDAVGFSATELLAMEMQVVKDNIAPNDETEPLVQVIMESTHNNGDMEMVKLGPGFLCIGDHFFCRFDIDIGEWILEGVSDSVVAGKFYAVEHPPGKRVVVKLAFGTERAVFVRQVVLESYGKMRKRQSGKKVIDLVEPRNASSRESVQRLYLNCRANRLYAMTAAGIYVYDDEQEEPGFRPDMNLAEVPNFDRDTVHHIRAPGLMVCE